MPVNMALAGGLAALAAGGVAYVFLYPLLSGDARAEKRKSALVGASRRVDRAASSAASRRDQVAQTLKDVEARERGGRVTLEMRLAQAGLGWTKRRFYGCSAGLALALGLVALVVTGGLVLAAGAVFIGGFGLPRWGLAYLKRRRIKRFVDELPNALDVIVRGVRAGLPLNDCLRMVASEAREPLRSEFRTVVEAQTLGIPIGEACCKVYERVPVPEANFFGIVIAIQQKAGGSLSEAIGNLSRVLRERKKMSGKVQAMSMEAKASAAIIAALPFIVALLTYLSSPDYIRLLWTTQTGKIALAASAIWMFAGISVMKKMISFQV